MCAVEQALAVALVQHRAGRPAAAAAAYEKILRQDPGHAGAWHLLGVTCQQQGDLDQAARHIRRAIGLDGTKAIYHNNLGVVLRSQGRMADAEGAYRQALALRPEYADALSNLGALLQAQDQPAEALPFFRHALQVQPAHVDALYNLGNVYHALGRTTDAIVCYQQAQTLRPRRADIANNLGNTLLAAGREAEATASYRRALSLNPGCAEAHLNLGVACAGQGHLEDAARCFEQAARLRPEHRLWKLRAEGLCPAVFPSAAALDKYRSDLAARLDRHLAEPLGADWRELAAEGFTPSFQLCHQGRNNRPLLAKFAALFEPCFPKAKPRLGKGLPRLGFVVTRHREAGFLRDLAGIVEHLDRTRFEVVMLCSQANVATCRGVLQNAQTEWVAVPDRLGPAVERITAARCDLVYHWQIGTEPLNYFLPFAPLAPVQCTGWGSHGTTGIRNVDYYVSSRLVEPAEAAEHFTERLVQFEGLTSYQRRVPPPAPATRDEFGLPRSGTLYICPGRLGKLHPESDPLLAAVLRGDPQGTLVLLEGKDSQAARALRRRFQGTLAGVHERVLFLPAQAPENYHRLLSVADVFLDAPHYSAGFTGYDAFSLDLPIVTLPGGLGMGNYVRACYRKMDLEELVSGTPEEYVSQAVRLGTDREYREAVRALLQQRSELLFEDLAAVREHEQFFETALAGARLGET